MNSIITLFLIVLGIFTLWQVFKRIIRRYFNFPATAFIGRFLDSDYRRRMQPPDELSPEME